MRNEKGFTLIEIIAVLVILGILAAVAIPKYLSMADDARIKAAQGAIAEVKGRLSQVQARMMMVNNGTAPSSTDLIGNATTSNYYGSAQNLVNVGSDYVISTLTAAYPIVITVTQVQGQTVSVPVGNFYTVNGT
jgi:MSHA pilin protein MshA